MVSPARGDAIGGGRRRRRLLRSLLRPTKNMVGRIPFAVNPLACRLPLERLGLQSAAPPGLRRVSRRLQPAADAGVGDCFGHGAPSQ